MTTGTPLASSGAHRVALPVYESAFKANPFVLYWQLGHDGRDVAPVILPNGVEAWLVVSYDAAAMLLNDAGLSKDSAHAGMNWHEHHPGFQDGRSTPAFRHLLTLDPPGHTRLRATVQQAFSQRRIEMLRPRIEALAETLLDWIDQPGVCDLIESFALPLPLQVVCEFLGVPLSDEPLFRHWSRILVTAYLDEQDPVPAATRELHNYLLALAKCCAAHSSVFWDLAQRWHDGGLTTDELTTMGFLILVAGHETTVNLIGSGVLALLTDRRAWQGLTSGTLSVMAVVDELLRLESPVEFATLRFAREYIAVQHHIIRAGDAVFIGIAAANRDTRRFDQPDRLMVGRAETHRHLAFGQGIHFCLGAALARMEGEIAFARLPGAALAVAATDRRAGRPVLAARPDHVRAASAPGVAVTVTGGRQVVSVQYLQPGFAPVADAFSHHLASDQDCGASLCVYRHGRVVVDVWGGLARPGQAWQQDTLVPLTSITKPVLAAALLAAAEGLGLHLDVQVSALWPGYAGGGKSVTTIAHVLSHRAGLPVFDHAITLREQIKRQRLISGLSAMHPIWPPGTVHGYHAITYGFLATELIERMTGCSAATTVQNRVVGPIGADVALAVDRSRVADVALTVTPPDSQATLPWCRSTDDYVKALRKPDSLLYRATFGNTAMTFSDMNDPDYFTASRPAAYGTAAGVARLFAALAGVVDGVRILSPATMEQLRQPLCNGMDRVFQVHTRYGLGVMLPSGPLLPNLPSGAFGHLGSTGAFAFADPEHGLAFAYLPNRMKSIFEIPDRRASDLVVSLYQCL